MSDKEQTNKEQSLEDKINANLKQVNESLKQINYAQNQIREDKTSYERFIKFDTTSEEVKITINKEIAIINEKYDKLNKNKEDLTILKKEIEQNLKYIKKYTQEKQQKILQQKEYETNRALTLTEVLKHPLKYSKSAWRELSDDFKVIDPKKLSKKQALKINTIGFLGGMASFGIWSTPHELIHAGINKLTGGQNLEIVINQFYGGDLAHAISPDIQSKLMIPLIGGYVQIEPSSAIANIGISIAPYALTPLGVYLMQKSRETQKLKYLLIGSGLIYAHWGGALGDFYSIGRQTILSTYNTITQQDKKQTDIPKPQTTAESALLATTLIGGFIIGNKIMSYTYRLSKGLTNTIRNYFKKE